MDFTVEERPAGDVTFIDLKGMFEKEGSYALRSKVRQLCNNERARIILNLKGVEYIDSTFIGELVSSFTYAKKSDGEIVLSEMTQKVQDLLAITKLLTVFDTYDADELALRHDFPKSESEPVSKFDL